MFEKYTIKSLKHYIACVFMLSVIYFDERNKTKPYPPLQEVLFVLNERYWKCNALKKIIYFSTRALKSQKQFPNPIHMPLPIFPASARFSAGDMRMGY